MEQQFNVEKVIGRYKLDTEELAKVLFPTVKYPKQAFGRVLKGEAYLDTVQLENMAKYIGVPVTDLFNVDTWRGASEDECLVFLKGVYKVKLNYNGVYVSIYKDNKLIHQRLSNMPAMTVGEFINFLNNFIKNYENGNN